MKEFFRRTPKRFTAGLREDQRERVPDNLWVKCQSCGELIYQKQLQDNRKVCPKCGHHFRLMAAEWVALLLDPESFQEHDAELAPVDPLGFVSPKESYGEKLRKLQERTGSFDALIAGSGTIEGLPLELAVSNFEFIGGSMGSVYGEKIARAAERAAERGVALVSINSSGGARMEEGLFSLMQMAKASVALTRLAAARQPHISLLVDPCYGGVSASYASVADVVLAEPGARIGFAGPRVIEQTTRHKLPPNFQSAEMQFEHGMIDAVVARPDLRPTLARLLRIYRPDQP